MLETASHSREEMSHTVLGLDVEERAMEGEREKERGTEKVGNRREKRGG